MAGQNVSFDFTSHGASQLAGDFRKTGDSAVLAAKGARLLGDALQKQQKATDVAAGATIALAKADKILADAEHVLADGALEAEFALKKEAEAAKQAARENEAAAGGMSALAGTGGIPGGGMGAAIAAGVALSPILVTLGTGLGGLGLAAYGIIKPIENAAQKTGGLQANMHLLNAEQQTVARGILGLGAQFHKFEGQLQPTVLADFSAGLHLAGGLLQDIQPVAKATGAALGGVLGQIDQEFQSQRWQQFFGFMAATAGPDLRQLGTLFVDLTNTLPPLLENLQPVATGILQTADAAAKLVDAGIKVEDFFKHFSSDTPNSANLIDQFGSAVRRSVEEFVPGIKTVPILSQALNHFSSTSGHAAVAIKDTGAKAATSAVHLQTMAQAVLALNTAESKSLDTQLAYSGALITAANDAVSLRKALKASHDEIGLHTAAQRASFGAANTYIGDLEQVAKQSWASGHGTKGAADAIRNALPLLDSAATKNKNYWTEVKILKGWLDKLTAEKKIQEVINLTGNGAWSFGAGSQYLHGLTAQHAAGHAAGYLVPGYGGGDRHPALLEGGEAVVPKHLVPAVAPFLSSNKVPGFATGGLIPSYGGSVAGLKPWGEQNWNATIAAAVQAFVKAGKAQQASLASSAFGAGGTTGATQYAEEKFAASLFPHYGWSGLQILPLGALWTRESGWNRFAYNASSGATGIPQALPYSKMPRAAWLPSQGGQASAAAQIAWGESYIAGRYGSPAAAWAHELSAGWYGKGLDAIISKPTLIGVGERGPERVQVTPRGLGRGGGDVRVVLEVRTGHGATNLDRAIVEIIQNYVIAKHGGDAQHALGSSY